jgi:hypothetical protein
MGNVEKKFRIISEINTKVDFRDIMSEDMKWSRLVQDSNQQRVLVNKEYSAQ